MTDIVERLRSRTAGMGVRRAEDYDTTLSVADVVEAADEIERLRARLAWWDNASHEMLEAVEKAEAERDEAIQRGNDWCDQAQKARDERDRLREALRYMVAAYPLDKYKDAGMRLSAHLSARAALKEIGHE